MFVRISHFCISMIIQIGMKCKIEVELKTEFLLNVDGTIVTFVDGVAPDTDSLHSSFVITGNTHECSTEARARTHTLAAVAVSPLIL